MSEIGPLAIAYSQGGRQYESGGWTPDDVTMMLPPMEAEGCTIHAVYDAVALLGRLFRPGMRVAAPRKWWGSQTGTVTAGEDGSIFECFRGEVPQVLVKWDNGPVLSWWPHGLQVAGMAGGERE